MGVKSRVTNLPTVAQPPPLLKWKGGGFILSVSPAFRCEVVYERCNYHSAQGVAARPAGAAGVRLAAGHPPRHPPGHQPAGPALRPGLPVALRQRADGDSQRPRPAGGSLRQVGTGRPLGEPDYEHPQRAERPGSGALRRPLATDAAFRQPRTAQRPQPGERARAPHRGRGQRPGGADGSNGRTRIASR